MQTLSRSPSPIPKPPSAEHGQEVKPSDQQDDNAAERSESLESQDTNKKNQSGALEERGNNKTTSTESKPPGKSKEDATADAASILLQLSSVMKNQDGNVENENPEESSTKDVTNVAVPNSSSMDEVSDVTHLDSAPDLTSEPSSDSIDHHAASKNNVTTKYSDFPCPVPDKYPTRLSLPYDASKLNSLHCFLRSELLEIFVVEKSKNKSPTHSPHSSIGRVGLRCAHCFMARRGRGDRDEAPMAVFYPKSIAEIYRLVTSWQRCHLRKCRNLPPAVRSQWQELRETDKSRGKTHYWVSSAKEIGLMDCQSRAGGVRFAPDFDFSTLPLQSRLISSLNAEEKDDKEESKTDYVENPTVSSKEETEGVASGQSEMQGDKQTPENNADQPMEESSEKREELEDVKEAPGINVDQPMEDSSEKNEDQEVKQASENMMDQPMEESSEMNEDQEVKQAPEDAVDQPMEESAESAAENLGEERNHQNRM